MQTVALTRSRSSLAETSFLLFVLLVGLHRCNYLIDQLTGINIQQTVQVSILAFSLVFLYASYVFSKQDAATPIKKNSVYVTITLCYVHLLLVYGFMRGNKLEIILEEYWTGLIILFSYKLALNLNVWRLFERKLVVVYLLFSVLVFAGIGYLQEHLELLNFDIQSTNVTTALLAYEISPILDFWPFILLLGLFSKNKFNKAISFVPFIIYMGFQIFFLKRAPTIRAALHYVFGIFIYLLHTGNQKAKQRYITILLLFVFVFIYFLPEDLVARFESTELAQQSRPDELFWMLSQLNVFEILFGRGLGGEYMVASTGIVGYVKDGQELSTVLHIGAGYPILKGGVLLFILITSHIIFVIRKGLREVKTLTREQLVSLSFLIVFIASRFIEGPISPGSLFNGVLYGMSLGCLEATYKSNNSSTR
jgi:hypothetical protein